MNSPTIIVLFGITGDLAQRKILPALHDLFVRGQLQGISSIVGFSRREMSTEDIREFVRACLPPEKHHDDFLSLISYIQGNFDDGAAYLALGKHVAEVWERAGVCGNTLFYLSVPPIYYETIATSLSLSGLSLPCGGDAGFARILIEKPFGNDLATAIHLDTLLGELFREEQVYRIDHYLGKAALRDVLVVRGSPTFRERLTSDGLSEVHINLFETHDVAKRTSFYDPVGAFRDVGQNHMLQMLALSAVPPESLSLSGREMQNARARVLDALLPLLPRDIPHVVRAQYVGYRSVDTRTEASQTETFFRIPAHLNLPEFRGVTCTLSSGKALAENRIEIIFVFKNGPPIVCTIPQTHSLEAYQKILLDAVSGDQTLFTSTEEILAEWRFVESVLSQWKQAPLLEYEKGAESSSIV